MHENRKTVFERNRKKTLIAVVTALLIISIVAAEIGLRVFAGLGRPQQYYKDEAFGFRLKPNQEAGRYFRTTIKTNNLGLRAADYWDDTTENKVLFLGDSVTHGGNRLSDDDLFSRIAVQDLSAFESGNAGVPNWGVENIYGLIMDAEFRPANTYVTTLIEHDFYRGMQSGDNKPWIWYESPRFALCEASSYAWYRYFSNPRNFSRGPLGDKELRAAAERATRKLKHMDEALKSRGDTIHLIFISPTRAQVLGLEEKDPLVQDELTRHGINAVYLLDEVSEMAVSAEVKEAWFQDGCHLTENGHRIWGGLIGEMLKKHLATVQ